MEDNTSKYPYTAANLSISNWGYVTLNEIRHKDSESGMMLEGIYMAIIRYGGAEIYHDGQPKSVLNGT
jgi:hypothetical protein